MHQISMQPSHERPRIQVQLELLLPVVDWLVNSVYVVKLDEKQELENIKNINIVVPTNLMVKMGKNIADGSKYADRIRS